MSAPKTARSLVKSKICPKERFPYVESKNEKFYKPSCVEGVLGCKELCGKRCTKECKQEHNDCSRGKLDETFMFCPMANSQGDMELPYVSFAVATQEGAKEGKKAYKKTERVMTDMNIKEFEDKFKIDFHEYSKHEVESWYINSVRNAAFSPNYMPKHVMRQVMDFAQNLVHDRRHAVSEEYFHKAQSALSATVTGISTPVLSEGGEKTKNVEHIISQITSSDNKYVISNIYFIL